MTGAKWADYLLTGDLSDIVTLTPAIQAFVGLCRSLLLFIVITITSSIITDVSRGINIFTVNYLQSIGVAVGYLILEFVWRYLRGNKSLPAPVIKEVPPTMHTPQQGDIPHE